MGVSFAIMTILLLASILRMVDQGGAIRQDELDEMTALALAQAEVKRLQHEYGFRFEKMVGPQKDVLKAESDEALYR
jgi:hypothetical protein